MRSPRENCFSGITILVLGIEVPSDVALDPSAIALKRGKHLLQLLV